MAIIIEGIWVYPENLRRALVFRKLLGRVKEYAIRTESDKANTGKVREEVL